MTRNANEFKKRSDEYKKSRSKYKEYMFCEKLKEELNTLSHKEKKFKEYKAQVESFSLNAPTERLRYFSKNSSIFKSLFEEKLLLMNIFLYDLKYLLF
jgi:hypothetical protein